MGILTDVFLATDGEVLASSLGRDVPRETFPTVEAKRLTSLELTCLAMALSNEDPDALAVKDFVARANWPLVGDWGEEVWVQRLPAEMLAALAGLTAEHLPQVVSRWLAAAQMRDFNSPETVSWLTAYVRDLGQLARQASASDHALYLWMSL
jgi:hypothetical protein